MAQRTWLRPRALKLAVPVFAGIFSLVLVPRPLVHAQSKNPAAVLSVNFDEPSFTPPGRLDSRLFFDASLSEPAGQSCATLTDGYKP